MRGLALVPAVILANLLVVGSAVPGAAAVSVRVNVSFGDSLSPYGDWVQNERFGSVWTPRHVDHGWRPYAQGHWAYTDDDWTWVSDEEWGWATDHYGRWFFDPEEGWIWIPGEEWAPAWVAWRHGGGYVGWAPLPPDVEIFENGADPHIDASAYCFVEERHMMDRGVYRSFVPPARNVTYINITLNATRYAREHGRIVNRGIDIRSVERFTGHAVPRGHIREAASAAEAHAGRNRQGEVAIFRPRAVAGEPLVVRNAQLRPAPRVNVERPDQLARRQQQERQKLESRELHERGQLRQIQQREVKHPPLVNEERSQPEARTKPQPRPPAIDSERLRARHDAEQKAQVEHEQREQQVLRQRQQRETRAVAEAQPKPERQQAKAEKPADPPRKQRKDKPDKD